MNGIYFSVYCIQASTHLVPHLSSFFGNLSSRKFVSGIRPVRILDYMNSTIHSPWQHISSSRVQCEVTCRSSADPKQRRTWNEPQIWLWLLRANDLNSFHCKCSTCAGRRGLSIPAFKSKWLWSAIEPLQTASEGPINGKVALHHQVLRAKFNTADL